ncbi:MAG: hypothetical protein E7194_08255 [Erysipelotrichaceae bacterium]|nr:hypothetical protein [Erysipelotrichaceae bacterium]
MVYPKPLSEKSLKKKYLEAEISDEEQVLFHQLFDICAALYGLITVQEAYDLYEGYRKKNNHQKINKAKLLAFTDIARREELPYYVYEMKEVFDEETEKKEDRLLIRRELVTNGMNRFHNVYSISEKGSQYPPYVPEDLFAPIEDYTSFAEIKLQSYLDNLVSDAKEIKIAYNKTIPNPNRGKKLRRFSFENSFERYISEKGVNPHDQMSYVRKRSEYLKSIPASERVMEELKFTENTGFISITDYLSMMFDNLEEMGVRITDSVTSRLIKLVMDFHNNFHSWSMNGWSPAELTRSMPKSKGPAQISFGPNIEKMIANGEYDRKELVEVAEKAGLRVEPNSRNGKS